MSNGRFDLEDRLIKFSVLVIQITEDMPNKKAANHLASQILRSGTSVALNYGEAQGAESRKDFIHKLKVVLKEMRETFVCLKIIEQAQLYGSLNLVLQAKKESDELIAIFVKSVETTQKNMSKS